MSDLARTLSDFIESKIKQIKVILVCEVQKFDSEKMTVDIQPLYERSIEYEGIKKTAKYPVISKVKVNCFYAGGFLINPNYTKGDLLIVGFACHNISKSIEGTTKEESKDLFGLENAIVLGSFPEKSITNSTNSSAGICIEHKSGYPYFNLTEDSVDIKFDSSTTAKIEADKITFKATDIKLDGDLEVTGSATFKDTIEVDGTSTLNDDVEVDGKVDASGDISSEGEVKANSKSASTTLSGHIHSTSAPGAPTGSPTPGT